MSASTKNRGVFSSSAGFRRAAFQSDAISLSRSASSHSSSAIRSNAAWYTSALTASPLCERSRPRFASSAVRRALRSALMAPTRAASSGFSLTYAFRSSANSRPRCCCRYLVCDARPRGDWSSASAGGAAQNFATIWTHMDTDRHSKCARRTIHPWRLRSGCNRAAPNGAAVGSKV